MGNVNVLVVSATLHCLTGCAIGEIAGLIIGTTAGLSNGTTIIISIVLAFFFGFSLVLAAAPHSAFGESWTDATAPGADGAFAYTGDQDRDGDLAYARARCFDPSTGGSSPRTRSHPGTRTRTWPTIRT